LSISNYESNLFYFAMDDPSYFGLHAVVTTLSMMSLYGSDLALHMMKELEQPHGFPPTLGSRAG
jgi:hypothetical protein